MRGARAAAAAAAAAAPPCVSTATPPSRLRLRFFHRPGLPLRKAAFSALEAVVAAPETSACVGAEALPLLCSGLRDTEDIKIMAHAVLAKLARAEPPRWRSAIAASLPDLAAALATAFDKPPAGNGVEAPPSDTSSSRISLFRSAMRTIDALIATLPNAMGCAPFAALFDRVSRKEPALAQLYAATHSEAAAGSA